MIMLHTGCFLFLCCSLSSFLIYAQGEGGLFECYWWEEATEKSSYFGNDYVEKVRCSVFPRNGGGEGYFVSQN